MDNQEILLEQEVRTAFQKIHARIESGTVTTNYLFGGKLGLVLYYFSLYEGLDEADHANKCLELLDEVMNQEEDEPAPLAGTSFASGTAGLGYILSLLQRSELAEIDLQEDLKELDASMAAAALRQITEEDRNDYLHGAMGVVHYFTTRSKEPIIRQYLETLVTAFCNKAVVSGKGLWFRNFIIDKKERERIDTGLSHGNAGFLLILLNVWEAGVLKERLMDVISKGIEFLISQQMKTNPEEEQHAFFPFSVNATDHNDIYFSQRLAWCYGDLNILLLLYRAGSSFKINRWTELADTLSGHTVKRMDATATLAVDSHFCHGTAGLAQFYRTLYTVTKNGLFDTAADYWIGRTIQLLEKEWKENTYNGKECDLINGLPGINLVLLSYLCKKELAWSRSLLL